MTIVYYTPKCRIYLVRIKTVKLYVWSFCHYPCLWQVLEYRADVWTRGIPKVAQGHCLTPRAWNLPLDSTNIPSADIKLLLGITRRCYIYRQDSRIQEGNGELKMWHILQGTACLCCIYSGDRTLCGACNVYAVYNAKYFVNVLWSILILLK